MSSEQELNSSIELYKTQLSQVENALKSTSAGDERKGLLNLKKDLNELVRLTQETLDHECPKKVSKSKIDDEFALFMSEIKQMDTKTPPPAASSSKLKVETPEIDLKDELSSLVGSKCSAPHTHTWGSKMHHNAFICGLDDSDVSENVSEIMVKVFFVNPTHQEMLPCSYYLDGSCKFNDEKCKFSHGEAVLLSELKDYREPNFSLLHRKNCSVLAMQKNKIWGKGVIQEANFDKKICQIKMEESKKEIECNFEDIFPIDDGESDEVVEISDDEHLSGLEEIRRAQMIQKSLLNPVSNQKMGEWEQYTRGIGSKLMQKMGYVIGTGLGSNGEGIIVPISAQVLPQGRSLDYCMDLREAANGDKDLFSVEKKLKRMQKKQEQINQKAYEKGKEKVDVFTFMNTKIFNEPSSTSAAHTEKSINIPKTDLKAHSSKNLNVASLKLTDEIRRKEREVVKLRESLLRHKQGTPLYTNIKNQMTAKNAEIKRLQDSEHTISREQKFRQDHKKLVVF